MPDVALAGVQLATGTLVVTTAAGQLVVVKLLAEVGPDGVQLTTGTLVVGFDPQLVATKLLPDDAATGVQVATGTFVVVAAAGQLVAT